MHASTISSGNPICLAPSAADKPDLQKSLRTSVLQSLNASGGSIAQSIRSKLGKAESSDAAADVLTTIDAALEKAAKAFADQGIDQKIIDAALEQFRGSLSREIDSLANSGAGAAAPVAGKVDAVAARQVVKEKFSLDIVTAENDRVSIKFRSKEVTEFAAAKATTESGTALVAGAQVISRGKLQIEVQGDLNETELAAIGDLLDKVNGIAEDFFGGDVEAAFAAASRVDFASEALSGFDLNLRYSKTTAYARQYSDAAPAPAPALKPLAPAPVTAAPVATVPVAAEPAAPVPKTIEAPTVPGIETTVPATEPTGSASSTMLSFAKDVLSRLGSVPDAGSVRFSLQWKVEFLLTAISTTAATKPDSQPAVAALGDTLNQAVSAS